jgi:Flp pilus assembly pilin Flp
MHAVALLKLMLDVRLERARDERGVSAVEWVIITAMLVLIAGAVYAVLRATILDKAESINLDT